MNPVVTEGMDYLRKFMDVFLTRFVVAIVILLVGLIIGKILGRLLQKALSELEIDKIIKKATGMRIQLEELSSHGLSYLIYFIAVIMALKQVGIASEILNLMAIGLTVVILLSIFLGVKDFVPNAVAGVMIHHKKIVKEGDKVKVLDIAGKIEDIGLVDTKVRTKSGDIIHVPNSLFIKNIVEVKK